MHSTTSLIRSAKRGNARAKEDLFALIYKEHLGAWTRRYRSRNILVDDQDVESEFMLGCLTALQTVSLTKGNPLLFMLWKGNLAVADLLRSRIQKGVRATCYDCGITRSVKTRRGKPTCRGCGSTNLRTFMVVDSAESLAADGRGSDTQAWDRLSMDRAAVDADSVWGIATYGVQVEEMRSRLNGRVLELFDLIVIEEVNRETSQNYIREIAERWGVTTACVSVYLRKLRAAVELYLAD